jgi:hypothetical protein
LQYPNAQHSALLLSLGGVCDFVAVCEYKVK